MPIIVVLPSSSSSSLSGRCWSLGFMHSAYCSLARCVHFHESKNTSTKSKLNKEGNEDDQAQVRKKLTREEEEVQKVVKVSETQIH